MECSSLQQYTSEVASRVRRTLAKEYIAYCGVNVGDDGELFSLDDSDGYEAIRLPKSALPAGMTAYEAARKAAQAIASVDSRFMIEEGGNIATFFIRFPDEIRWQLIMTHYMTLKREDIEKLCRNYLFKNGQKPLEIYFEDESSRQIIPGLVYETAEKKDLAPFPIFSKKPKEHYEKLATLKAVAAAAPYKYAFDDRFNFKYQYGLKLQEQ